MLIALLVLFYIISPAIILYLCKKVAFLGKFGAVGISYIVGLILGNIGILNLHARTVQETVTNITIPLALPLILMSINLKQWSRLALKTILSLIFGIVAVVISVSVGYYLFRNHIADNWKIAGMLTGVYLGGTFNMAAISHALKVDNVIFGVVNGYDIIVCMFYFMFIISVAQRLFNKFLVPFEKKPVSEQNDINVEDQYDGWDSFKGIFTIRTLKPLLSALGVAVLITVAAGFFDQMSHNEYKTAIAILIITTLSILVSLIPYFNRIRKTFQSGMYLILIFCVAVGSMADLTLFANVSIYLLYYVSLVIFGSLFLHTLLAKIFGIDTDTLIITSIAFIFSPPFVPAAANALHNREIVLSGLTVGIIGYAIGNYLGIGLAYFLR